MEIDPLVLQTEPVMDGFDASEPALLAYKDGWHRAMSYISTYGISQAATDSFNVLLQNQANAASNKAELELEQENIIRNQSDEQLRRRNQELKKYSDLNAGPHDRDKRHD